jgi:hypothetical protein
MLRFQAPGLRVNSALPSSLPLLLFFLPFTWGRHQQPRATTALPRATSLELLILFDKTKEGEKTKQGGQQDKGQMVTH